MSANPTPASDPPARLAGTEPITMRHVVRIVWPRTVWMLTCTWPGLSLLAVLGVWLAVAVRLGDGVWQVVLLALAGCLVTLGLLPVFQLGVVARRQGRIGYATNTALVLVTSRGDDWFLGEHFSWPKGTGPAFRAALFPQLAAAALAAGVDVTATITSKRVYAKYEQERWLEGADQVRRTCPSDGAAWAAVGPSAGTVTGFRRWLKGEPSDLPRCCAGAFDPLTEEADLQPGAWCLQQVVWSLAPGASLRRLCGSDTLDKRVEEGL